MNVDCVSEVMVCARFLLACLCLSLAATDVRTEEHELLKRNLRTAKSGGAAIELWTDGTAYRPGTPIKLSLSAPELKGAKEFRVDVEASIRRKGIGKSSACKSYSFDLERQRREEIWAGEIVNLFPAKTDAECSLVQDEGDYELSLRVRCNGGDWTDVKPMALSVVIRR